MLLAQLCWCLSTSKCSSTTLHEPDVVHIYTNSSAAMCQHVALSIYLSVITIYDAVWKTAVTTGPPDAVLIAGIVVHNTV
jgi:hypothetical protein